MFYKVKIPKTKGAVKLKKRLADHFNGTPEQATYRFNSLDETLNFVSEACIQFGLTIEPARLGD